MSLLSNKSLFPFFAPESPAGGAGGNTSGLPAGSDKESIIEFLGQDDDKEPPIDLEDKDDKDDEKDDKKGKAKPKDKDTEEEETDDEESEDKDDDEESEDSDELDELEEELEEPDDEKLELVTPVRRSQILKKYPSLFKDFPYLEKAYYREQQFTNVFATPAEAKDAADKAGTLDKFEKDLMAGNTQVMLQAVKNESPKSFAKMVDNYLGVLQKVDEKAYHHVIGNTIKHTIMAMVQEGRTSGNEVLQNAAQILNQFVFGSSNFIPPQNLSSDKPDETDEREVKQQERERRFQQQRYNTANEELSTRVTNAFKATIEAHIDPKESMTDFVRRNAVRDALENLEDLIGKDTRFKTLVDKLWEKAIEEDFSKQAVERIRSAFLSKAKTLLKPVIQKARVEALRGMGKRVRSEDKEETTTRKGSPSKDKPPSQRTNSGKVTKPSDIPKGMSTLDFLMSED